MNIREYLNIAEPNEYFSDVRIVGGSAYFIFQRRFVSKNLHRCTLPRSRRPPYCDRRNDSNRPTQPGSSYRWPVLLKAALFLLFRLMKEKARRPIKIYGIHVKPICGALFENATVSISPGFCCKLQLRTLVSLEVEFSLFYNASLVIPRISKALRLRRNAEN